MEHIFCVEQIFCTGMEKSFEPVKSCPNIENIDEEITVKPGEGHSDKGIMIMAYASPVFGSNFINDMGYTQDALLQDA